MSPCLKLLTCKNVRHDVGLSTAAMSSHEGISRLSVILQEVDEQLSGHSVNTSMTPTHGFACASAFRNWPRGCPIASAVFAFGFLAVAAPVIGHGATVPRNNLLPRYELKIDPASLRKLDRDDDSNQTYAAKFFSDGSEYAVKVRLRGAWARSWPKKALKIFFEDEKGFEGNRCLNLNSAWRDAAFVREPLAYHVYSAAGVPASRARMVQLHINGQFRGLYVEVEQPDNPLLKRHNLKGAALYKANSPDNQSDERNLGSEKTFAANYEKQTRKSEGHGDLQAFCRELAAATNALEFFTNRIDVERYINYLAASALVQNWDGLSKNHFLVHDERGSKKWLVVPWDLDRTFGDHWQGGFDRADVPVLLGVQSLPGPTGWNRMADRFLRDATLRNRFLNRLAQLLQNEFTPEKLFPLLDGFERQLAEDAARDRKRWPGPAGNLHEGVAEVKRFIERRRIFLQREITKLRRG